MTRRPLSRILDTLIVLGSIAAVLIGFWVLTESTRAAEQAVVSTQATLRTSRAVMATIDPDRPPDEPGEAADECDRITEALLADGYLSDAVPLDYELQDILRTACTEFGVDYPLALGLIETESAFRTDADNGLCYGLCQINRDFFPDGLSPAENIRAGMEYLGGLLARYETTDAALTAYNAGHDTGRRGYANAVLARAEAWRAAPDAPKEDKP